MSNQNGDDEMRGWTEIEPKFESQRQAFQRRRDNLVVSVEREGMSCYNVVTLPENFDQDNQVIDCIGLGVEREEDAVETAREFMEQNNATTVSNQIEDDEIEQSVNKTTNIAAPCVSSGIVCDLLTDELDSWHLGICAVEKDDDDLLVCDENGQVVDRVDTDVWTTSTLFEGIEVKDLAKIADTINGAIKSEYDEL
jgi:hypothetical protein